MTDPAHQFDAEPKRAYAVGEYSVDWAQFLANYWERNRDYALGNRIRSRVVGGFEWEATTPGVAGSREPLWPTTIGATVTDGSVVWTCRAASSSSLRTTVSTSAWTADNGLTLSNETLDGQRAIARVAGGTSGELYSIFNRVVFADGTRDEAELVIPVRD